MHPGHQQAVPAARVARGDPGPVGGAPLQRDEDAASRDAGDGHHQSGDSGAQAYV